MTPPPTKSAEHTPTPCRFCGSLEHRARGPLPSTRCLDGISRKRDELAVACRIALRDYERMYTGQTVEDMEANCAVQAIRKALSNL